MANMTPARYVCRLLGVRALARELGLSPGAVSKWQTLGLVPSQYHVAILMIARKKRKRITERNLIHGG